MQNGVGKAQGANLSVVLTGQALIQSDVRKGWPDAVDTIRPLLSADVVFTNFESMVLESGGSMDDLPPHNMGHYGPPEMLDVLTDMGFNLIGTANNHAYDLLDEGVLNVIRHLEARNLAYSGTGADVEQAAKPGYLDTPNGRVALVSAASGAVRDSGAATATKPGVNEIILEGGVQDGDPGQPSSEDADRILRNIAEARENADIVISYHHNHLYDANFGELIGGRDPNRYIPPRWIKEWSRKMIDAGADIVVHQGLPLVQGIEVYQGRPIFYDMGNFMFQLDTAWKHMFYPGVFRGAVARVEFEGRTLKSVSFQPIVLTNEIKPGYDRHLSGIPSPATGADAESIIQQIIDLSAPLGTHVRMEDGKAVVDLEPSLVLQ